MLIWLTTSWGAEPNATHRADHRKAHCICPNRLIEKLQDFSRLPLKTKPAYPFLRYSLCVVFLFSLLSMWGPGYLYYSKIDTGHVILKSMTIPLVLLTFRNRIFSPDHSTISHFSFPVLLPKQQNCLCRCQDHGLYWNSQVYQVSRNRDRTVNKDRALPNLTKTRKQNKDNWLLFMAFI